MNAKRCKRAERNNIFAATAAFLSVALLSALPIQLGYAESARAFDADVVRDWHTAKLFTLAVAEAMPADKYDFKVAPGVRSFGELMIHIATSQAERFAQISGVKPPFNVDERSQAKADKAGVLKLLAQSFDFCIARLDSLTPAQLKKSYKVDWYERPEVSGREMVTAMFVHTAHHRAQAEVYLRANGITPPAYRF
jgi:uncharacterized damage-inducible protein DinB